MGRCPAYRIKGNSPLQRGHIQNLIFAVSSAGLLCTPHLLPTQFLKNVSGKYDHQLGSGCCETVLCDVACIVCWEVDSWMLCMVNLYSLSTSSNLRVLVGAEMESKKNRFRSWTVLAHARCKQSPATCEIYAPFVRPAETNTL